MFSYVLIRMLLKAQQAYKKSRKSPTTEPKASKFDPQSKLTSI